MMPDVYKRPLNKFGVDYLWWPRSDSGGFLGPLEDWDNESSYWMSYVKKFDTVVQAGGLCGLYPLLYANLFNKVYTFEPSPLSFYCLTLNCPYSKITKINAAVGEHNQQVELCTSNVTNVGCHFITENKEISTVSEVPTFTIDQLALTSCDLIHLDIEGYEEKAITGATNTIRKFKPTVITEEGRGRSLLLGLGYIERWSGDKDVVFTWKGNINE